MQSHLKGAQSASYKEGIFVPEVVSRFLKSRGFLNLEDQIDFVNPSLKNIKDPFSLYGMKESVERLYEARLNNQAVGVYCDYDLDGSSAAAILKDALTQLGFLEVYVYQPRRLLEGYGFHKKGVDEFLEKGVGLIVTADVGITAHDTCEYAKSKGLDVIITDHHLPDASLPQKAFSVINPNIKECTSGLGHLCGAGVAFYLIYALAKRIKENAEVPLDPQFKLENFLDFLVIGTLTDMVPLVKENRVLVKKGLHLFTNTKRAGLRALKARAEILGKDISSMDIGFKIAPKLNSLSRLDTDLRPTEVMIESDRTKAELLVKKAYEVNEERLQSLQAGLDEALNHFKSASPKKHCFYCSNQIHPGVMGLIATRLVDEYGLPAFVGSELENGQIVGSARLPKNSGLSLKEILGECQSLMQYGGHAEAAGFELQKENVELFQTELQVTLEAFSAQKQQQLLNCEYDCEVYLSELNRDFLKWMKHLEPFGVGFAPPCFKVSELEIASFKKLKEKHYKINVVDKAGARFDVLWFSPPSDHEVVLMLESGSFTLHKYNFYVQPQINYFRNLESLQLLMGDVEVF